MVRTPLKRFERKEKRNADERRAFRTRMTVELPAIIKESFRDELERNFSVCVARNRRQAELEQEILRLSQVVQELQDRKHTQSQQQQYFHPQQTVDTFCEPIHSLPSIDEWNDDVNPTLLWDRHQSVETPLSLVAQAQRFAHMPLSGSPVRLAAAPLDSKPTKQSPRMRALKQTPCSEPSSTLPVPPSPSLQASASAQLSLASTSRELVSTGPNTSTKISSLNKTKYGELEIIPNIRQDDLQSIIRHAVHDELASSGKLHSRHSPKKASLEERIEMSIASKIDKLHKDVQELTECRVEKEKKVPSLRVSLEDDSHNEIIPQVVQSLQQGEDAGSLSREISRAVENAMIQILVPHVSLQHEGNQSNHSTVHSVANSVKTAVSVKSAK